MAGFTIMSFNIKGSYYEDGANNWPHRAALNVAAIRQHDPDLIGFQELQQGNLETYQQHLPGYAYELGAETARENNSGKGYYCAIAWKVARFEPLDRGVFYLNTDPEVYGLAWGTEQGRTVNWVKLLDTRTSRRLLHINTHLHHDSAEGRLHSARLIVERLPGLMGDVDSVVLTADFNARAQPLPSAWFDVLPAEQQTALQAARHWMEDSAVYDIFRAVSFRDSYREAGHTDAPTANTFHGMRGADFPAIGFRIDWILLKDVTTPLVVKQAGIETHAAPPLYPSDHYPVMAVVEPGA